MERLTIEDIKQTIHKLDIAKRPYALLVNPEDAKTFRDEIPDIEEYVELMEREGVEKCKAYIVSRKDLEDWLMLGGRREK